MSPLAKHKEFIKAVALQGFNPNPDNIHLNEVLDTYRDIDPSVEVLAACATCDRPYEKSFKIILAYCEDKKWFNPEPATPSKTTSKS